jgi:hypothetical protein
MGRGEHELSANGRCLRAFRLYEVFWTRTTQRPTADAIPSDRIYAPFTLLLRRRRSIHGDSDAGGTGVVGRERPTSPGSSRPWAFTAAAIIVQIGRRQKISLLSRRHRPSA